MTMEQTSPNASWLRAYIRATQRTRTFDVNCQTLHATDPGRAQNIRLLLEQCNVTYRVTPFDEDLYQECVSDAVQRGYLIDGDSCFRTYLRQGVVYAANAARHIPHRLTQIWIAFYISCAGFVDDAFDHFPEQAPNIYFFNDRFIRKESQGNPILDTFADTLRRASDLYQPIASQLITTSTLTFIAATILEHETRSVKISSTATEYPAYQRNLTGFADACAFMVFPREIPLNDYIRAIPEIRLFLSYASDVVSFYKEELAGETANHISTLAARSMKSKLDTLDELTDTTIDICKRIVKILEGSPEARETFERFPVGFIHFHTTSAKYRLEDLDL